MKYVIIGNGVAGTTAAAQIRKRDEKGEITILSEEALPFYSRIRLIDYLAGEATRDDIVIRKRDWYEQNRVRLRLDQRVTDIDARQRKVITEGDEQIAYDRLLIATGGVSFIPPIAGSERQGVFSLRTVDDADQIIEASRKTKEVILIGGGVLGLEAGNSLRKRGCTVTVVEFFPRLLPRQMDPEGADILKAQMESMGFTFYLEARTREITGTERADGILLEDGTRIEGGMIIVSAGVRPRAGLAKKLGLTINKGVSVNDRMETEMKDIYAAGDLIEHRGMFYGIWPAAEKQGEVAGINMAGGDALYEGTTMSNMLKVVGVDLAAAGDIDAEGRLESIVQKDRENYVYRKIVLSGNTIAGCSLYGETGGFRKILKAMEEKRDISSMRADLERWKLDGL